MFALMRSLKQDGTGKINPKILGTVLQCCGFLESRRNEYDPGRRRESKWDMFEAPVRHRRESKWNELIDATNLFSEFIPRRTSICDMNPDLESRQKSLKATKDVTFSTTQPENVEAEAKMIAEEEKQAAVIGEVMSLIDRRETGTVEFPEFIETIMLKILQDAVTAGVRGNYHFFLAKFRYKMCPYLC